MLNVELHKGTAVSGRGRRNYFSVDTQQEIMNRNAEWGSQKHTDMRKCTDAPPEEERHTPNAGSRENV